MHMYECIHSLNRHLLPSTRNIELTKTLSSRNLHLSGWIQVYPLVRETDCSWFMTTKQVLLSVSFTGDYVTHGIASAFQWTAFYSDDMRCGGTVVIGLAVLLLSGVLQWSLVLASNQRLHLAMTGPSGNEDGAEKRELAGPALPSSGQMQACGEWRIPRMRFWGGYLWINEGAQEWLPQMRLGKQELGAIAEKLKWGLRFNYD